MPITFKDSETAQNLLRAFAGESQARNRYTFAASLAKQQQLHIIEAVFHFTARQEKAHAALFYNQLQELSGKTLAIDASYPIDLTRDMVQLLRAARHNEYEESQTVYPAFGAKAREEGFTAAAALFESIAPIEASHGNRFGHLAQALEDGTLFVSGMSCEWMCLNCGHIFQGSEAPKSCPVCHHDQGFFIRLELAPFGGSWVK